MGGGKFPFYTRDLYLVSAWIQPYCVQPMRQLFFRLTHYIYRVKNDVFMSLHLYFVRLVLPTHLCLL